MMQSLVLNCFLVLWLPFCQAFVLHSPRGVHCTINNPSSFPTTTTNIRPPHSALFFFTLNKSKNNKNVKLEQERDTSVQKLLNQARALGPVGKDRSETEQLDLVEQAQQLAPYSDANPAQYPLRGIHNMVYSAAPGGSSGKIGPFVGRVQQEFVDNTTFINRVSLGPLTVELRAQRKVMDSKRIKVTFQETTVYVLGKAVTTKELVNQGGVWNMLFAGEITDETGQRKLLRVMETPSLFVIEQDLDTV